MFLCRFQKTFQSRRFLSACLAVGLSLHIFVHPASLFWLALTHLFSGLCLGFFLGGALWSLYQKRRAGSQCD